MQETPVYDALVTKHGFEPRLIAGDHDRRVEALIRMSKLPKQKTKRTRTRKR